MEDIKSSKKVFFLFICFELFFPMYAFSSAHREQIYENRSDLRIVFQASKDSVTGQKYVHALVLTADTHSQHPMGFVFSSSADSLVLPIDSTAVYSSPGFVYDTNPADSQDGKIISFVENPIGSGFFTLEITQKRVDLPGGLMDGETFYLDMDSLVIPNSINAFVQDYDSNGIEYTQETGHHVSIVEPPVSSLNLVDYPGAILEGEGLKIGCLAETLNYPMAYVLRFDSLLPDMSEANIQERSYTVYQNVVFETPGEYVMDFAVTDRFGQTNSDAGTVRVLERTESDVITLTSPAEGQSVSQSANFTWSVNGILDKTVASFRIEVCSSPEFVDDVDEIPILKDKSARIAVPVLAAAMLFGIPLLRKKSFFKKKHFLICILAICIGIASFSCFNPIVPPSTAPTPPPGEELPPEEEPPEVVLYEKKILVSGFGSGKKYCRIIAIDTDGIEYASSTITFRVY